MSCLWPLKLPFIVTLSVTLLSYLLKVTLQIPMFELPFSSILLGHNFRLPYWCKVPLTITIKRYHLKWCIPSYIPTIFLFEDMSTRPFVQVIFPQFHLWTLPPLATFSFNTYWRYYFNLSFSNHLLKVTFVDYIWDTCFSRILDLPLQLPFFIFLFQITFS